MIDEPLRLPRAALDLEREDRAAAVREIFPVQPLLLRILRDGRMVDPLHLRMAVQVLHHPQRVFDVALHPQGERFQPLQEQERMERRERRAHIAQEDGADLRHKSRRAGRVRKADAVIAGIRLGERREFAGSFPVKCAAVDDYAAQRGAVPADEFCRGMDDDIRAVLDGAEQVRRREGVVHHERDPVPVGDFRGGFDVCDVGIGVAERLKKEAPRVLRDRLLDGLGIQKIGKRRVDAVFGKRVRQQVEGAAVNIFRGYDAFPGVREILEGVGERGSPRSDRQSRGAALQCSHAPLKGVLRGVRQARIDVPGLREIEPGRCLRAVFKYIGRGLIDRHSARAGRRIRRLLSGVEL